MFIIPAADRARRDRKQHADTRDLILPARDPPAISLSYIYTPVTEGQRPRRRRRGAAAAVISAIVRHNSCQLQSAEPRAKTDLLMALHTCRFRSLRMKCGLNSPQSPASQCASTTWHLVLRCRWIRHRVFALGIRSSVRRKQLSQLVHVWKP